ncbi:hypothetical protein AB6H32_23215 [Providencia hangzhouensis]
MFIILMTTQVIVFCLMLFVYLRSRLHGGSDKYLNTLVFCFILLTVTLIITQSPAPGYGMKCKANPLNGLSFRR